MRVCLGRGMRHRYAPARRRHHQPMLRIILCIFRDYDFIKFTFIEAKIFQKQVGQIDAVHVTVVRSFFY